MQLLHHLGIIARRPNARFGFLPDFFRVTVEISWFRNPDIRTHSATKNCVFASWSFRFYRSILRNSVEIIMIIFFCKIILGQIIPYVLERVYETCLFQSMTSSTFYVNHTSKVLQCDIGQMEGNNIFLRSEVVEIIIYRELVQLSLFLGMPLQT